MKRYEVLGPYIIGLIGLGLFASGLDMHWWQELGLFIGVSYVATGEAKGLKRREQKDAEKAEKERLVEWAKKHGGAS